MVVVTVVVRARILGVEVRHSRRLVLRGGGSVSAASEGRLPGTFPMKKPTGWENTN